MRVGSLRAAHDSARFSAQIAHLYRGTIMPRNARLPYRTLYVRAPDADEARRRMIAVLAILDGQSPERLHILLGPVQGLHHFVEQGQSVDPEARVFEFGPEGLYVRDPLFLLDDPRPFLLRPFSCPEVTAPGP